MRLTLTLGNAVANTAALSSALPPSASDNASAQGQLSLSPQANLALSIKNSKKMSGTVQRKRSIVFSEDSIVIRVLGTNGGVLFEDVKPDPRVIRDELPAPGTGNGLVNRKVFRNDTPFLIDVPDMANSATLQILKPTLTDNGFTLTLLSSVDMN